MRFYRLAVAAVLLSACGKSSPPAPAPAADVQAATGTDKPPGSEADTKPAPEADTKPAQKVEVDPNTYLVWWQTERGDVTSWVAADGEGVRIEASRPQVVVFADETLFGLELRYTAFTETNCEDFENERKTQSGKRFLPHLVARGLAGRELDQVRELTSPKSAYFIGEPSADGVHELVGEHWGRTHKLVGSWRDLFLFTECEGAYACGAHGDTGCAAGAFALGAEAHKIDLEQVAKHVAPLTKEVLASWGGDDEEVFPELNHLGIKAKGGEVAIDYVYVASVPYAGTDGSWSSYSQSRTYTGAAVEALGLGELPAVVRKALDKAGVDGHFGWSVIKPDHLEAARRAFDDPSTLPGAAPADEVAPTPSDSPASLAAGTADTASLVESGRKLTRERDFAGAVTAFDKAIAAEPKLARAWSGRGFAKLGMDDLAGAKADFERALTLEDAPKFQAAVYFNLGEIAEKQSDKATARAHYEKANTLAPSNAAKKRIETLDKR